MPIDGSAKREPKPIATTAPLPRRATASTGLPSRWKSAWPPMISWAALIVVLLIVSALPYFLGLVVTLPVLGHATWHLYRRLVVPVP